MARSSKATASDKEKRALAPAATQEEAEARCIGLAMNLAEEQLRNGTASPSVISHFHKIGTLKEQEELEKLKLEKGLLKAKTEAYESAKDIKALYEDAIGAMKSYSGSL